MRRWRAVILIVDVLWIPIALLGSIVLRYGLGRGQERWAAFTTFAPFAVMTCVLWLLLSLAAKIDGFRGGWYFPAVVSRVIIAVVALLCAVLACGYAFHDLVSRLALAYFAFLLLTGFIFVRYCARLWLQSRYGKGHASKVVIIGWGRIAQELARKLSKHPEMLYTVVGFLCPRELMLEGGEDGRPTITGATSTVLSVGILDLLRQNAVDRVIVAFSRPAWPEVLRIADQCRAQGIAVSIIPHPYELYLSRPDFTDLDGLPLIQLHAEPKSESPVLKRVLDLVLANVLIWVTSPFVLAAAVFLRITKGQSFRVEDRCGQYGKRFRMLRLNIDRQTIRRGSFEWVLDRLGVVELPQLWNVLCGEMSLVGPRPESPDRVRCYTEWQQQRLRVKPGITGLAQVYGLREHNSSEEKARFDLQYSVNQSVFLDLSLLLQTLWTVSTRVLRESKCYVDLSDRARGETQERAFAVGEVLYSADSTQSSAD